MGIEEIHRRDRRVRRVRDEEEKEKFNTRAQWHKLHRRQN